MAVDDLGKRLAEDVLHDHPLLAARVGAEVVEVDEIGVFEIEAVADAAELGVGVPAEKLERNFLTAVRDGEVNFAEPALAHAPLEGEAIERPLPGPVSELQSRHCKPRRQIDGLPASLRAEYPLTWMIRFTIADIKEKLQPVPMCWHYNGLEVEEWINCVRGHNMPRPLQAMSFVFGEL